MGISRRKFISRSAIGSLAIPFARSNFNTENNADKQVTNPQKTFSILCLGSGAADWDVKEYPQDKKILLSTAYRGQSSVLINNSILVDCGVTEPASHLSKNSHPSHGNVATNMKTEQIITANDGAEFSI